MPPKVTSHRGVEDGRNGLHRRLGGHRLIGCGVRFDDCDGPVIGRGRRDRALGGLRIFDRLPVDRRGGEFHLGRRSGLCP